MKKKLVDIHAQYIPKKTTIKDYLFFAERYNFSSIILTPPCVNGVSQKSKNFILDTKKVTIF